MRKINLLIVVSLILLAMLLPNFYRAVDSNGSIFSDVSMLESYTYAQYSGDPKGAPSNLYELILVPLAKLLGVIVASKLMPILLGLVSLLFLYMILNELKLRKESLIILLVLAFSPAFLYLSSVSTKYSLMQALLLSGIYFLIRQNAVYKLISVGLFAILGFFGFYALVIPVLGLFFYTLVDRRKRNVLLLMVIVALLISSFYYVPQVIVDEFELDFVFGAEEVTSYISDLGGIYSVSIFAILICFFGLFMTWGAKKKFGFLYLYSILIILMSFFIRDALFFANILIAFYIGIAIRKLYDMKWEFKILKFYTILLIVCSLLFSSLVGAQLISDLSPSAEYVEVLEWLGEQEKGVLLTDINFGSINNFYGIQSYLALDYKDIENRNGIAEQIYHGQDIRKVGRILYVNKINYIIITPEMREELWDSEEGLLFLLRNEETFKRIHKNEGIEVYKVL